MAETASKHTVRYSYGIGNSYTRGTAASVSTTADSDDLPGTDSVTYHLESDTDLEATSTEAQTEFEDIFAEISVRAVNVTGEVQNEIDKGTATPSALTRIICKALSDYAELHNGKSHTSWRLEPVSDFEHVMTGKEFDELLLEGGAEAASS